MTQRGQFLMSFYKPGDEGAQRGRRACGKARGQAREIPSAGMRAAAPQCPLREAAFGALDDLKLHVSDPELPPEPEEIGIAQDRRAEREAESAKVQ
jgi:hypothetical protein